MAFNTSSSSSAEKRAVVNPKDLRFTQPDIKSTFKDATYPTVKDTASLMQTGKLSSDVFGDLAVHKDKKGVMWCDNNRRLFALREAGVESVSVKFDGNRSPQQAVKSKLKDPAFMPNIRGEASGFHIPSPPSSGPKVYHEQKKTSVNSVPIKFNGNAHPQKAVQSKPKMGGHASGTKQRGGH
ncbi:hypothetical protein SUGI_0092560 [Cryptomeria japonica]|nr:hypothetical protein SUGI_0092560 [Cryptomeria japonica]